MYINTEEWNSKFSFAKRTSSIEKEALIDELYQSRIGRIVLSWIKENNIDIALYTDGDNYGYVEWGGTSININRDKPDFEILTTLFHEIKHCDQFKRTGAQFSDLILNPFEYLSFTRFMEADAYSFETFAMYLHCKDRGYDMDGFLEGVEQGFKVSVQGSLERAGDFGFEASLARQKLFDAYFKYPEVSRCDLDDQKYFDPISEIIETIVNWTLSLGEQASFKSQDITLFEKICATVGFGTSSPCFLKQDYSHAYTPFSGSYLQGLPVEINEALRPFNELLERIGGSAPSQSFNKNAFEGNDLPVAARREPKAMCKKTSTTMRL